MRLITVRLVTMIFFVCICAKLPGQSIFTGINDSVINLPCSQPCANLNFQIPHLKSSENYSVISIPYSPYPYTTATGNELTDLYDDDVYGAAVPLPFPICFYGDVYNNVVVGSNGLLTFDISNGNCANAFTINPAIPYAGGVPCDQFSIYYPRAAIMGAYSDLDASNAGSPSDRKIEWRFEGAAPFRRFIASWYHVGVFGNIACSNNTPTTFQIVVNEATAVIEVFFDQKICNDFSGGKAILGVQNWNKNQAVAAPGKNATQWTAVKEGYRFIPSGATSLFVSSQLLTLAGVPIETAATATTTPGLIDISFPTPVCPANASEQFIVRTIYSSCTDPTARIIINDTITINQSVLTTTATTTQSSCASGTGTITATIPPGSGSSGPYTFVLNPGNVSQTVSVNTTTFSNLIAGDYTITASDVTGICTNTISVTVTSTGTFDVTYSVNPPACTGASNGSITINPPTGGPFQFTVNGSPMPGNVLSGLPAGNYLVNISTGPTCFVDVNITIPPSTSTLTGTATATATSCSGAANGTITISPTNGSAPYQYSLNGGINQASNVFTVSDGSYTVVITDAFGCATSPIPVTVTPGPPLESSQGVIATSCNGASDGSIIINTNNIGTPPFQFSLNGGAAQTSNTFLNLPAGNYTINYSDAAGCTSGEDIPVTVPIGPLLTGTATSIATACSGINNGSITVTVAAGFNGPFEYALDGGVFQTSNSFTGVVAGDHNALIRNAAGCVSLPIPASVASGSSLSITTTATAVTCNGASNGIIAITPANGSAPYQYSLDGGPPQASNIFTGVSSGQHNVAISDNFGCISSNIPVTVDQPAPVTAIAAVQNVLCNGQISGVITVTATGGTTAYSYSLDNVTFQPANTFNVVAGIYTVYIRDGNNCATQVNNITVNQPATLAATVITGNATCDGGNDGAITVTPSGGASPYQYSSDGITFQASAILKAGPGNYDITVKDANGCTFIMPDVIIGLTNNLSLAPATDPPPICEGSPIQLQAITNATEFSWTPATGLSNSTIDNPIANPMTTTLYRVVATLGRCSIPDDILVTVMPAPIPDAGPPGNICYGQKFQLQGSGGVTYNWTPSDFLSSTTVNNPEASPDKTIIYTLNVTDANGCASLVPDQVVVKVTPPIEVTTFPSDTVVLAGSKFQLLATSVGTDYTWSPATGLDNPNIPNPAVTAPAIDGNEVIYKVTVTTSADCLGEGYARVRVYKGPDIYVPTAFTPNNDGKNEVFKPFPVGIKQLNYFRVFNRWGQMLYSTSELNRGWDGRFGGIEHASGVYVWIVEGITMDNKIIIRKGTVTLIR